jgi:hypothetical protein
MKVFTLNFLVDVIIKFRQVKDTRPHPCTEYNTVYIQQLVYVMLQIMELFKITYVYAQSL